MAAALFIEPLVILFCGKMPKVLKASQAFSPQMVDPGGSIVSNASVNVGDTQLCSELYFSLDCCRRTPLSSATHQSASNGSTPQASPGSEAGSGDECGEGEAYERTTRSVHWQQEKKKPADLLPFKAPDGSLVFDRSRSTEQKFHPTVPGISITDDLDQPNEPGTGKASKEKKKTKKESDSQFSQGENNDDVKDTQKQSSRCASTALTCMGSMD
jgi:hypothetical protein